MWNREGLGTCPAIDAAGHEWRRAEDVILRFIDECLELGTGGSETGGWLYETYRNWCEAEGRRPKSNKNFSAEFLDHDAVRTAQVTKVTRQHRAFYKGVTVRTTLAL